MATDRLEVISKHLSLPILKTNFTNATINTSLQNNHDGFRYSLNNSWLTLDQRRFYEDNGYIVINKLIEDELLDEFSLRFIDLCNGVIPKGGITLMRDISLSKKGVKGEYLVNKIQDISFDEVFEKYILHPELLNYISCFTGPNIRAMTSMLINKPPDSGALTSRHPLHQDLYYFPFRPADRIVASWTAMEPVTIENGCLVVVPGSHKGEILQHGYPNWEGGVNAGYHGIKNSEDFQAIPLKMEKGDTVFFHPLLIHGSGANTTKGFRKAITVHYTTSDCYYVDVMGTVQEEIANEVLKISATKGMPMKIQDMFKLKSRPVRGYELIN